MKLKYYLLFVDVINEIYLVRAENKKEAKNIIWNKWFKDKNEEDKENGYSPIYKNDINVVGLDEYNRELKEDGFVMIN